jgi:hypothetical protein
MIDALSFKIDLSEVCLIFSIVKIFMVYHHLCLLLALLSVNLSLQNDVWDEVEASAKGAIDEHYSLPNALSAINVDLTVSLILADHLQESSVLFILLSFQAFLSKRIYFYLVF